jgi:hypothetical protein
VQVFARISHTKKRNTRVSVEKAAYFSQVKRKLTIFVKKGIKNKKSLLLQHESLFKKLDRNIVTIGTLEQDPLEETRFWLSKTPSERLIALELLRSRLAGYDNTHPRLQRFFTVTIRV